MQQFQQQTKGAKGPGTSEAGGNSSMSWLMGAGYAEQQQLVGAGSDPATYVVQSGDTLSAIAARELGSAGEWKALWEANKGAIKNPNLIHKGQVLVLPGSAAHGEGASAPTATPAPAQKSSGSSVYVVQSGDTLSEIAGKTLGSASKWRAVWEANKSKIPNPNVIHAGQSLVIPGGAPQAEAPTAKSPEPPKQDETKPPQQQPTGEFFVYTVKPMDSLSYIAKVMLGDSSKWQLIYEANKDIIKDPGNIHPGMQLKIPGAAKAPEPAPDTQNQTPGQTTQPGQSGGKGTLDPSNLSPLQKVCYSIYKSKGSLIATNASSLGVEEAVLAAVLIAESSGTGYGNDGKLKIRFEPHIFEGYTGKSVADTHSNQAAEYAAFENARKLDENAAYLSISMGAAQIMGFNHASVGYETPRAMFEAFSGSEEKQLQGLFGFVASHPNLIKAAKAHDWASFAKGYNGPGYKKYGYDTKLANYFASYNEILKMVGKG